MSNNIDIAAGVPNYYTNSSGHLGQVRVLPSLYSINDLSQIWVFICSDLYRNQCSAYSDSWGTLNIVYTYFNLFRIDIAYVDGTRRSGVLIFPVVHTNYAYCKQT